MKKNILGGKSQSCKLCGGTVIYIYVKGLGVLSQCRDYNALSQGRELDEIKIYTFEEVK